VSQLILPVNNDVSVGDVLAVVNVPGHQIKKVNFDDGFFRKVISYSEMNNFFNNISELNKKASKIQDRLEDMDLENQGIKIILRDEMSLKKKIENLDNFIDQVGVKIKDINEKSIKYEETIKTLEGELNSTFDANKAEIEKFKLNFQNELRTQAPRGYWSGKLTEHRKFAKTYAIFASLFACIAVFCAIKFGPDILQQTSLDPQNLVLWPLGLFASCGFVFVWVERILVRLLLSHLHLADDANERIVMVETYFAILTQNAEKTGEAGMDLGIMLQTLFRPAATGIIKDEGVPAQFWDLANRAIGSGGAKPGGLG
jgi:hypothetical protein